MEGRHFFEAIGELGRNHWQTFSRPPFSKALSGLSLSPRLFAGIVRAGKAVNLRLAVESPHLAAAARS